MGSPELLTPTQLADAFATGAQLCVLDVRWTLNGPPGRQAFDAGHIPTAVFCDLDRDLAGRPGRGGRHPLPTPLDFTLSMRRLGVSRNRTVVVYDASDATSAARAWWCLRYFGHDDVHVLDGGFRAWVDVGLPVATDELPPEPGDFTSVPGGLPVVDAEGAADVAARGCLIDVRAPARYRGDFEPVDPVAGHIPGAVNLPAGANVGADGRFRDPERLRQVFAGIGAPTDDDRPVAAYCGSGVTAAHTVLALALVGQRAALYAGSWSDWITKRQRPVATGPDPR